MMTGALRATRQTRPCGPTLKGDALRRHVPTSLRTRVAIPPSPPRVLRLVVLQVLPALDRAPPLLVVAVPLDRRLDGLLEPVLRLPAELALDPGRVDRVAAVVAGA